MTQSLHSTELRTRDRSSDCELGHFHERLFRELRAALPPELAEAVVAVLCGPFYDGPPPELAEAVEAALTEPFSYKVSGAATHPIPPQSPRAKCQRSASAVAPPPDGLLAPAAAARKLGCSIKTLNGHVAAGALRYVAVGHGKTRMRKMFAPSDIDEFIAAQTRKDVPCPSTRTETVARRIGISTSNSVVLGFTAQRNAERAAKPKR